MSSYVSHGGTGDKSAVQGWTRGRKLGTGSLVLTVRNGGHFVGESNVTMVSDGMKFLLKVRMAL